MDDPIRNDSLKSSDRMKQEANDLAYCEVVQFNLILYIQWEAIVSIVT